ncbi:zinc ribbon domain-containing protein [Streptomyces sp. NPDC001093]|uniref:zinc ribbon domain-containing protein n=1 Tax=Streptomyces sp. NPDC001093 TaxID=3154376 RepID=UPI0033346FC9
MRSWTAGSHPARPAPPAGGKTHASRSTDRTFHCTNCTLTIDRDLNAARNIAAHAIPADRPVAPGRGETQNARGAPVRPPGPRAGRQAAMKREDTSPPRPAPPQRSDPLTLSTLNDIGHETAKQF